MKNVQQHDALLEQAIDIQAARALCRDGWSCEQINSVLKNTEISYQEFETIQVKSREFDELQTFFGSPSDFLFTGHAEPDESQFDFLNRGPDAAAAVLREKGWNNAEISLVIREAMFASLEESVQEQFNPQGQTISQSGYDLRPSTTFVPPQQIFYSQYPPNPSPASVAAVNSQAISRRTARSSFGRDLFILTFMAGVALAMVFTLL